MKAPRLARLAVAALLLVACSGDGPTSSTTPGGGLVGTWLLVSVDNVTAPPGTLRWVITSSTITADSQTDDCVDVGTYVVSGNTITATTISLSGSACAGTIGEMFGFTFTVASNTLTAVFTDPVLGTATFVFERA